MQIASYIDSLRESVRSNIVHLTEQALVRIQYPKTDPLTKLGSVLWIGRIFMYGIAIIMAGGIMLPLIVLGMMILDTYYHLHSRNRVTELDRLHENEAIFDRLILQI